MALKIKDLKIIALNVNSIVRHTRRANLKEFMEKTNPDILLINETKLNKKYRIAFEGYNMARNDRPDDRRGGGPAILMKEAIKYEEILYRNSATKPLLEATIIKIKCGQKNLYVVSIYATNRSDVSIVRSFRATNIAV